MLTTNTKLTTSSNLLEVNNWQVEIPPQFELMRSDIMCPARENVFRSLEFPKPEEVRVVILGQDPYHAVDPAGNRKASGLSFGYHQDYRGQLDSSLLNIRDELAESGYNLTDRSLESWARQGVLLLNTQLTTEIGKPLANVGLWDRTVLGILDQIPKNAIWLCWGRYARLLADSRNVEFAICTSHPSQYSAHKSTEYAPAFRGSRCFELVNANLQMLGRSGIEWGTRLWRTRYISSTS